MTDDNSKTVDIADDLNSFSKAFFSDEETPQEEEQEVDDLGDEVDTPATETEDEIEDQVNDEEEDDESEPEPEPKSKKKNSVQERINELTAEKYETKRALDAALRELQVLKAAVEKDTKEEAPSIKETLSPDAPQPDAVDKNGEPIYPLGEFDPLYIRDLTRHTIEVERKAAQEAEAKATQQKQLEAEQKAIQAKWTENIAEVEKEIPDIRESISGIADVFADIEPSYGEFLATAVMSSDLGPQIMYYLSHNIGEAQNIVASGPAAALRAIGRLEGILSKPVTEEKRNTKKMSDAPPPPDNRSRGSGGKFSVAPDTRDLAAFSREFFKEP